MPHTISNLYNPTLLAKYGRDVLRGLRQLERDPSRRWQRPFDPWHYVGARRNLLPCG